jgi:anti-anti-sigma factor
MPLTVSSRVEDNFAVLELAGNLTLGPSLPGLRDLTRQTLLANKLSGMILQVGGITSADSAGLGELTAIYTFATRRGCPIMLVGVTPTLRNLLEMTRLDALLPSAPDVSSAKQQLAGS